MEPRGPEAGSPCLSSPLHVSGCLAPTQPPACLHLFFCALPGNIGARVPHLIPAKSVCVSSWLLRFRVSRIFRGAAGVECGEEGENPFQSAVTLSTTCRHPQIRGKKSMEAQRGQGCRSCVDVVGVLGSRTFLAVSACMTAEGGAPKCREVGVMGCKREGCHLPPFRKPSRTFFLPSMQPSWQCS